MAARRILVGKVVVTLPTVWNWLLLLLISSSSVDSFLPHQVRQQSLIPTAWTLPTPAKAQAQTLAKRLTNSNSFSRLYYSNYDNSTSSSGNMRHKSRGTGSTTAITSDLSDRLHIRYHGTWYDMTGWRKAHPAGKHWIDWFDQRDATDIIDGLHDKKARTMLQRLPKTKNATAAVLEERTEKDSKVQIAFRELYNELEADGWWERDMDFEYSQLAIWTALAVGAISTAHTIPILSSALLALSFVGAGWISHDYVHGLDPFARRLRYFPSVASGLCARWWSDKHNKHHALTNEMGVDEDMAADPLLYTWPPDPSQDSPIRRIQHWIFYIPFSMLFFLWRFDSVIAAVKSYRQKRPYAKGEVWGLILHYMILLKIFPLPVILPAILLSGTITAFVVTSTHQSEEKFSEYIPDHITRQFLCTRSVVLTNPISAWIWGGMQYQIEHHLFPSIPRSKLPALRLVLKDFAVKHNVKGGYRESGEFEILRQNWETYRRVALADAVPGAPLTRGRIGQQAAIDPVDPNS